MKTLFILWLCLTGTAGISYSQTATPPPNPKPVPRMQAVPQPYDQVSFQRDGEEITRLHFGNQLNRPFLFPLTGPSGRSLTRMGHPHDPVSHSHHNSVWISHNKVNGSDFWGDRSGARIIHQKIEKLEDGPDAAAVTTLNAWTAKDGTVLLQEKRRVEVRWLPGKEFLIVLDITLDARKEEVTLDKTPFGLIGVRMAKTIGVHDGGGTIRNSEGGVNEAGVFWKPARWVDYSGPITADASEGVTLFDHPSNPNHPSVFHVRNDGWMGASLTFDGPRVIKPGEPLRLRYGLHVHSGQPAPKGIEQRWKEFSELPEWK